MNKQDLPDPSSLLSLIPIPPLSNSHLPASIDPDSIKACTEKLYKELPPHPSDLSYITTHLMHVITPALSHSSLSPNYYGFVTGGCTPAARLADLLVSSWDQNVHVHLPNESIATAVEARAGEMLWGQGGLLRMGNGGWRGGFTTGATAGNVVGLALGREWVVAERGRSMGREDVSVGEMGVLEACAAAEIRGFQVLTTMPHSSLRKAAAVVGLGRGAVVDVGRKGEDEDEDGDGEGTCEFDFDKLEVGLRGAEEGKFSIVVISCGEVNTGGFATHSYQEMERIRRLCDVYGAWLHVDGAFGIFARLLEGEGPEFERIASGARGVELADSIAADAHKLLNVPYDCGFYFTRHPHVAQRVFQNPNAAYLDVGQASDGIQSPLNIGLENSRRFRALPVYATLVSYGRSGYVDMLQRQIRFARAVARYVHDHPHLEILPKSLRSKDMSYEIYIVVLFRAKAKKLNDELLKRINETSQIYVSGTVWEGEPACRIAVSNWQVDVERDFKIVKGVLESVLNVWKAGSDGTQQ